MNILLSFILVFIGVIIGMTLITLTASSKISEIEDERYNAEYRALTHFRKLFAIENIINEDEEKHDFITETMKKIKEVINDRKINQ